MEDTKRTMSGIVRAGYVCLLMSVIILPYLFGLAAFVLGIVATAKEQRHGVILIVAAPLVALASAWIGQMLLMGV